MTDITDITDLAKEILLAKTAKETAPLAVKLAQMVIDGLNSKHDEYLEYMLEAVRQEQKEKYAKMAEDFGEFTLAMAIREPP